MREHEQSAANRTGAGRSRSRVAAVAGGLALVLVAPYGLTAARAAPVLTAGVRSARQGMAAAGDGSPACVAGLLSSASRDLHEARRQLREWWGRPVGIVPVVAAHARALNELTGAAAGIAAPAAEAARLAAAPVVVTPGRPVDVAALARLQRPLDATVAAMAAAVKVVARVRSPLLLPSAGRRLDRAGDELGRMLRRGRGVAQLVRAARAMLGGGGPRRYFVAIENPAEQRASGGIIGVYAELTVTDGHMAIERLGRNEDFVGSPAAALAAGQPVGPPDFQARYRGFGPERYFLNAPLSPDFPTVATVVEDLYPRLGGHAVDGVISVDPIALAALLEFTGPVPVPGWPEPLTAANAATILLHDQYVDLAGEARDAFLLGAAQAIFARLSSTPVPSPHALVRALAPAVRAKHLLVHSARPGEQLALESAGLAGAIAPVRGDFLQVVTQNSGQNKIDWFQRRDVSYHAAYDPVTGMVRSRLQVRLTNAAPAEGLPGYIIGGPGFPVGAGQARSWVSVYSPLGLDGATLDGAAVAPKAEDELGRHVYSVFVTLGAGRSATLELSLSGVLRDRPEYHLDVGRQPTVTPDHLSVDIAVPPGWKVAAGGDLDVHAHRASARVVQATDLAFVARVVPAGVPGGGRPTAAGPASSRKAKPCVSPQ